MLGCCVWLVRAAASVYRFFRSSPFAILRPRAGHSEPPYSRLETVRDSSAMETPTHPTWRLLSAGGKSTSRSPPLSIADWATKDKNALLCQLNSYIPAEGAA